MQKSHGITHKLMAEFNHEARMFFAITVNRLRYVFHRDVFNKSSRSLHNSVMFCVTFLGFISKLDTSQVSVEILLLSPREKNLFTEI